MSSRQQADYERMRKRHGAQKAALTRAVKTGDCRKVVEACQLAVREWIWPDDWQTNMVLHDVYTRAGYAGPDLRDVLERRNVAGWFVGKSATCIGYDAGMSANSSETSGRAPFQVLVFPYREDGPEGLVYALLRRVDAEYWQGVAGGGEIGESPEEAARRETNEETGIPRTADLMTLDSSTTIPVVDITGEFTWGADILVVPEHAFGVWCEAAELQLSGEHSEYGWFRLGDALKALRWDSNRNALWELNERLLRSRGRALGRK